MPQTDLKTILKQWSIQCKVLAHKFIILLEWIFPLQFWVWKEQLTSCMKFCIMCRNIYLSFFLIGNRERWPWLLVLNAVPAISNWFLCLCPESPVYLHLQTSDPSRTSNAEKGSLISKFVLLFIVV